MATDIGNIRWGNPRQSSQDMGVAAFNIDASDEGVAGMIQLGTGDTITSVTIQYSTGAGTPPSYKLSLQTPGTDGLPDGTILGGVSPASNVFAGSAAAGAATITLDNAYTAARGQDIMVVIEYESGTADASNFSRFIYSADTQIGNRPGRPYSLTKTGGTWTKGTASSPLFGLIGSTAQGLPLTTSTLSADTFTSTTERGLRFKLPSGIWTDFDVVGVDPWMTTATGTGLMMVQLYDTDGTTMLQNREFDTDQFSVAANAGRFCDLFFNEATLSRLTPGSVYRVGFSCSTGTGSVRGYTAGANASLAAFPGGIEFYSCSRTIASYPPPTTGGNAWTDVTTTRPVMGIIIQSVTPITGGAATGVGVVIGG